MPDDTSLQGGQDRNRINVHQDHELRDWAAKFSVTPDQIKQAVEVVGDHADDVEMHLKGSRSSSNASTAAAAGKGAEGVKP